MLRLKLLPPIAVAAGLLLLAVTPASAEVSGPCKASINGTDVGGVSSADPAQAIVVTQGGQANVVLDASSPITELQIFLDFGGLRLPVIQKPVNGNSVRETVPVDQYATYGVGLYKVIGEGRGGAGTCAGSALVRVEGDPLKTFAGMVSAALAGIGVLGVLGATAAAAFGGPRGLPWRPKVSGLGLLAGLLAGLGGLILGQQYSAFYPTAVAVVTALVGGLVGGGALLPSLGSLLRR